MTSANPLSHQHPQSLLFITLDSCRYDTAQREGLSHLPEISKLHRAWSPASYTYASHMSMFMGFTPGDPTRQSVVRNPKFGKLFRMAQGGVKGEDLMVLEGANIKQGLKTKGYHVLGTGAVGWFNPAVPTSGELLADFDEFYYPGYNWCLEEQLVWAAEKLREQEGRKLFLFMNIGETHVPYYFPGASWSPEENPCRPFGGDANDAVKCRIRQRRALEYVDGKLGPLLRAFSESTIYVCADHGDCWGEDGLWEHGIYHPKVHEVPLWYKVSPALGAGAALGLSPSEKAWEC